jgi:hypothetical protein
MERVAPDESGTGASARALAARVPSDRLYTVFAAIVPMR